MKLKKVFLSFLFISAGALAQENETTMKSVGKTLVSKFPTVRTFDFQYEHLGPTQFDSKFMNNNLETGKIENHDRIKLAFNLPFYKSKSQHFFLTGSLRYKYESYSFGKIYDTGSNLSVTRSDAAFHYLAGAVSATYLNSLFNKPIIYNVSAIIDGNQESVQRIKGFVTANLVLKKTENTTMTVGLLANIDPSSMIPILPLFTYNHHFINSKWELDFIMPQRLFAIRPLLEKGRVSLGTEFISENYYLKLPNSNFTDLYELNSIEIKTGLTYEYHLTDRIIGTFKAGVNNVLNTRITEIGKRTDKYLFEQKQDAQGYFRIGLSYNPF